MNRSLLFALAGFLLPFVAGLLVPLLRLDAYPSALTVITLAVLLIAPALAIYGAYLAFQEGDGRWLRARVNRLLCVGLLLIQVLSLGSMFLRA